MNYILGSAYAYFKTEDEAKAVAKEMHKRDLGKFFSPFFFSLNIIVSNLKGSRRIVKKHYFSI